MPDHVDDFLAHYGVKGMKWGVRRQRAARAVGTSVRKIGDTPSKAADYAARHPVKTFAAVAGTHYVYSRRHEIAATAVVLGRIGKYAVTKLHSNDPDLGPAMALGRQVVQSYVISG